MNRKMSAISGVAGPQTLCGPEPAGDTVAVVGMACRFPSASDYAAFWDNLYVGRDTIREIPAKRWDPALYYSPNFDEPNRSISKWCGLLDGVDQFDNRFFNISPREARHMDPQQRLLLEEVWKCIEDSGIAPAQLQRETTSIYVGVMARDHLQENAMAGMVTDSYSALGNYDCILANRISYFLGLRGTSLSIDAACASSLVALHACKSELMSGSSSFAIAAGVSLNLSPWKYISFSKSRMLSPDGRCKTFDRDANGYVPGDGVGVLLLCTLERAQALGCHIYGLARGSAVNHVGQGQSITAPRVEAQCDVIRDAYRDAGFGPETVSYVEAHGTGTSLGDPIEVEALSRVFSEAGCKPQACTIGAVKSHIGHLEAAAGVAGVIKVLMMMRHRIIPANLNLKQLNPMIDIDDSPLRIASATSDWTGTDQSPLRAGVSSFGFGGVNAHVLLEAFAPTPKPTHLHDSVGYLFLLSSRTEGAHQRNLEAWRKFTQAPAFEKLNLHDLSATLCQGRASHQHRTALWFDDAQSLRQALDGVIESHPPHEGTSIWFTDPPWQGYGAIEKMQDCPGFSASLDELIAQLAELPDSAAWQKGFRAKRWSAKRKPVYQFILQKVLMRTLLHFGIRPGLIGSLGMGLPGALCAAGMIGTRPMLEFLAGLTTIDELTLVRPRIPFLDPISQQIWRPFQFDEAYFKLLLDSIEIDEASLDHYREKANQLKDSQHTFRKLLGSWHEILCHWDRNLWESLVIPSDQASPRERILLALIIRTSLLELNRKWDLRLRLKVKNTAFAELVQLLTKQIISREDVIELLLGRNPPYERLAKTLNHHQDKLSDSSETRHESAFKASPLPLTHIPDWYHRATTSTQMSATPDDLYLELGRESQPGRISWGLINGRKGLHQLLAYLWERGAHINWDRLYPEGSYNKLALPCYQFEPHTFWLAKPEIAARVAPPLPALPLAEPIPEHYFSTPRWRAIRPSNQHIPGQALWIGTELSLERARACFPRALPQRVLHLGLQNARQEGSDYYLDLRQPESFAHALMGLAQPDYICFFGQVEPLPLTLAAAEHQETLGILALFRLCQTIVQLWDTKKATTFLAITHRLHDAAGQSQQTADGALAGFLRSLAKEYPNLSTVSIDLDFYEEDHTPWPDAPEHMASGMFKGELSWRNGHLFEQVLLPVKLAEPSGTVFKQGGTYVIAGGMGGVGYVLASYLAHYQTRLVLLGRKPLDEALNQKVSELRALGAEPRYHQVDITNPTELSTCLAETRDLFGGIDGFFHSAMVYNEQSIREMSEAGLREVLRPKLQGLVALAQVLLEHPPGFLVFFSSAQSFIGNPQRAHYAASCTYADNYALALAQHLPCPIKIVNWGYWEVGAMADEQTQQELKQQGIRTLRPEWAMEALRRLLDNPLEQLVVLDLDPSMLTWVGVDLNCTLVLAAPVLGQDPETSFRRICAEDQRQLEGFVSAYRKLGAYGLARVEARMRDLGWRPAAADQQAFARSLLPEFQPLYETILPLLSGVEADPAQGDQLAHDPEVASLFPLLDACCQSFVDVIQGRIPATEVIFPHGNAHLVSGFYGNNRLARFCNRRVAELTAAYLRLRISDLSRGKPLRILEIGAGTGGTSSVVLEAIAPWGDQLTYCFTDLSQTLLRQARQRFGVDYPFMEFHVLNLEEDLRRQGFEPGSFDLVIATNVLHATSNIRQTLRATKSQLKRGGWLLLNELSEISAFTTVTFGLLPGWWLFEDQRLPGGPLLSPEMWLELLAEEGFTTVFGTSDLGELPQNVLVAQSDGRIELSEGRPAEKTERASLAVKAPTERETASSVISQEQVMEPLAALFGEVLEMPVSELSIGAPFAEFGADSLASVELIERINRCFQIELRSTDLFSHPTLAKLAQHISAQTKVVRAAVPAHEPQGPLEVVSPSAAQIALAPVNASPAPPQVASDDMAIAIVGYSGRFPDADDVDEFWRNLCEGRDSVTEIPASRWSLEGFYDPDPNTPNRSYARWAGMLDRIDHFDPLFFNLSPKEAERLDPQQRLFLQEAWRAFEHAGLGPDQLAGSACGVFAGVEDSDYKWSETEYDAWSHAGHSTAILPARLAYMLDLKGPCLTLNTACSSGLVALHQACESLRNHSSKLALVGAVAALATPRLFLALSKAGMLSPTGRCRSFDEGADGFVPAEAVCALVLMPLAAALENRATIHGLVRATAINHDGKTNGITAPSASSQTALICETYRRFKVDPASISYVEAHGTGTSLGDPIEVHALSDAFHAMGYQGPRCPIGAVKANIGHSLAASGLVGLIKILLCMRHRMLVPTPLFQKANHHINFALSPFEVVHALRPWQPREGLPLRAAVSAFGFSGTNAHVVIEQAPAQAVEEVSSLPSYLILISARSAASLDMRLRQLSQLLSSPSQPRLADLAYTLAVGRGHYNYRCAFAVRDLADLAYQLEHRPAAEAPSSAAERASLKPRAERLFQDLAQAERPLGPNWLDRVAALAKLYTQGVELPWSSFYRSGEGRRIPLPTYPFDTASYWQKAQVVPPTPASVSAITLLPLATPLHFDYSFSGSEFFLAEHVMGGHCLLPGVVVLELALQAARQAHVHVGGIAHVTWLRPFIHKDRPLQVQVHLSGTPVRKFELVTLDGGLQKVHAVGEFTEGVPTVIAPNLVELRDRCRTELNSYALLDRDGYSYGPRMRPLRSALLGQGELLAQLSLPDTCPYSGFALHPCLTDGVLQAATVMLCHESERGRLFLPYSLGSLALLAPLPKRGWVHVQRLDQSGSSSPVRRFRIDYLDEHGHVALSLDDYCLKEKLESDAAALHLTRRWQEHPSALAVAVSGPLLVLSNDPSLIAALAQQSHPHPVIQVLTGTQFEQQKAHRFTVRPGDGGDLRHLLSRLDQLGLEPQQVVVAWDVEVAKARTLEQTLQHSAYTLIALAQALIEQDNCHSITVFYTAYQSAPSAHAALSALALSLRTEHPGFSCRIVELADPQRSADALATLLLSELNPADLVYVRRGTKREAWSLEPSSPDPDRPIALDGAWLVSGGMGGLGLLFARQVVAAGGSLVLCGRSPLNANRQIELDKLQSLGGQAYYVQADLSREGDAERLVAKARELLGPLCGILHAAGLNDDGYLRHKRKEAVAAVFAPKIQGIHALDDASRNESLAYFICYSSTASVLGNAGQSDYAYANAYLNQFAIWREALVARGQRQGRSLSLAWGYWQTGGMQVSQAVGIDLEMRYGMLPMPADQGSAALLSAMAASEPFRVIVYGQRQRLLQALNPARSKTQDAQPTPAPSADFDEGEHLEATRQLLVEQLAEELGLEPASILPDEPLERYGIDSILVLSLNRRLERHFGALSKTLLFEYQTLEELAGYLARKTRSEQRVAPKPLAPILPFETQPSFQPAPNNLPVRPEDIAIIGLAGRYPQAENLEHFWANLASGRDSIVEVPEERWDWRQFQAPLTLCRWGGFLEGVDLFDPLLFQISPREAELIDPQERLFLETCWQALEDSGYCARDLAQAVTGVFVGVMYGEYQVLGAEALQAGKSTAASSYASVANRVSYTFNFQGPSLAVDSMCSSSLTAIHLACQAIRQGDCEQALAGGVNLSLHPNKYAMLRQGGFTASDGRCRSFGSGGDGYVPGEGVGAVLLKRAQSALEAGDAIWGIIEGSAINHGGKTNGYTVPNPVVQGELIRHALKRAGIGPDDLGYIEAHGTGTALGDPIEITGLGRALGTAGPACPIGSVKSNIGHLEAAAGIAALTKVLLQMKHRQLVPSLHAEQLNPHIDFSATRLRVQRELSPWPEKGTDAKGGPQPRRASISSFGAGGANGHLVVAEPPALPAQPDPAVPHLFLLSARNPALLHTYMLRMIDWIESLKPGSRSAAPSLSQLSGLVADMLQLPQDEIPTNESLVALGFDAPSIAVLVQRIGDSLNFEVSFDALSMARSLEALAERLSSSSSSASTCALADIAFTLQVGRVAQAERFALVAQTTDEVLLALRALTTGKDHPGRLARAQPRELLSLRGRELEARLQELVAAQAWPELAAIWLEGHDLDWGKIAQMRREQGHKLPAPRRISLPTHPFDHKRYWLDLPQPQQQAAVQPRPLAPVVLEHPRPLPVPSISPGSGAETLMLIPEWEVRSHTAAQAAGTVLLFDSEPTLFEALRHERPALLVMPGASFSETDHGFTLDPRREEDFALLFERLSAKNFVAENIWLAWSDEPADLESELDLGFHAVLAITRQLEPAARPRLLILQRNPMGRVFPHHLATAALADTIHAERSSRIWTPVSLEGPVSDAKGLIQQLLEQANTSTAPVRCHSGQRSVRVWKEIKPMTGRHSSQGLTWIVSGGMGGLGFILAEHLARNHGARLLLCGRSALSPENSQRLAQLRAEGLQLHFCQADVTRGEDCQQLVQTAHELFGPVEAVLHSAGLIRDAALAHKTRSHCEEVLDVKIRGALMLDLATQADQPRIFLCCSSFSAISGNAGQVDYAFANAYLDGLMTRRRRETGRHYQSISWPLWADGGMHIDPRGLTLLRQTKGLVPMPSEIGLQCFDQCLTSDHGHLVVAYGDRSRLQKLLQFQESTMPKPILSSPQTSERLTAILRQEVAQILKMDSAEVDPHVDLGAFGFESLTLTEFASALNTRFDLSLTPAQLYEYRNIRELAQYLLQQDLGAFLGTGAIVAQPDVAAPGPALAPSPAPRDTPAHSPSAVAILGMAGSLPGSPNLESFWNHLVAGTDLVGEIPADRWDWRSLMGDPQVEPGTTNSKWGGFLPEVFGFDASFFGISNREAVAMDPQQRLFLQATWSALEHAAIAPSSLAGSDTGVFVGCSGSDFADELRSEEIEAHSATGGHRALLSNRISFLLDLQGPSEVIDSACSSSLLAIHRAVTSLRAGECNLAIAGGVQLILSPRPYLIAAAAGMLSPSGRCRTFDASADGYVKGEGVGALVLKRLDQAQADGDPILATILGSAVNHGGHARSLTVPNPNAQADLLARAYRQANIDPASVTYLETHGTGTHLGDPIEVNGIRKAFAGLHEQWGSAMSPNRCGLGSVKSNIGHLEGAAGIAGVLKVLLSMGHETLPASLHIDEVNPYLELEKSPFYLVRTARPWTKLKSERGELPRRAGVSSFGFGGVNVHVVLEQAESTRTPVSNDQVPQLVLLSARNEERLRAVAQALRDGLEQGYRDAALVDIARTSQLGRDAMAFRLALIVARREQLVQGLDTYLSGQQAANLFLGAPDSTRTLYSSLLAGESGAVFVAHLLENRELSKLAQIWSENLAIVDWRRLASGGQPGRRIAMPGYVFAETLYRRKPKARVTAQIPASIASPKPVSMPSPLLVERLGPDLFQTLLNPQDYLAQHVIGGQTTLPGVAYLEIARAAASAQASQPVKSITNVLWMAPFRGLGGKLETRLSRRADAYHFEISSGQQRHAEGQLGFEPTAPEAPVDLAGFRTQVTHTLKQSEIYASFRAMAIDYGPAFQVLQQLEITPKAVLGKLTLPEEMCAEPGSLSLHPLILDGMLHAGLGLRGVNQEKATLVPFSLNAVRWWRPLPSQAYVLMQLVDESRSGSFAMRTFDLRLCDLKGEVCLLMEGLVTRVLGGEVIQEPLHLFRNAWLAEPISAVSRPQGRICFLGHGKLASAWEQAHGPENHWIQRDFQADNLDRGAPSPWIKELAKLNPQPDHLILDFEAPQWESQREAALLAVHELCRALVRSSKGKPVHFLCVTPLGSSLASALAAYGRTLVQEHDPYRFSCVAVDFALGHSALNAILQNELAQPKSQYVRYLGGERAVRALVPLEPATDLPQDLPLPARPVCLISGGAGGLGRILAKHLARQQGARLMLLGRRQESPEISAFLRTLEAAGGQARYFSGDVCDLAAMQAAVAEARRLYGPIQAVFHCAGVIQDSIFLAKDADQYLRVVAPKLKGFQVLDEVTRHEPLALMLAFSSASAYLPSLGQADYAAANALLDQSICQRSAQVGRGERTGLTRSLAWPLWAEGGMQTTPERLGELHEQGLALMRWPQALQAIAQVLHGEHELLVPLVGDRGKLIAHFGIRETFTEQKPPSPAADKADLKAFLRALIASALGSESVDFEDQQSFSEYGVDSFVSLRMLKDLEQTFGTLRKTLLFEYDSLDRLAQYLSEHHGHLFGPQGEASAAPEPVSLADPGRAATLEAWLRQQIQEALDETDLELKAEAPLSQYGVDSFVSLRVLKALEQQFGSLRKTLLFECDTLARLVTYLRSQYPDQVVKLEGRSAGLQGDIEPMDPKLAAPAQGDQLDQWLRQTLNEALGETLDIDPQRSFADYGVDSFISIRVLKTLEQQFGSLRKTLLFEYDSLAALVHYLRENHSFAAQDPSANAPAPAREDSCTQTLIAWISERIADALDISPNDLNPTQSFADLGVDSFISIRVLKDLEGCFGSLRKTLLFEYTTVAELATYFRSHHGQYVAEMMS